MHRFGLLIITAYCGFLMLTAAPAKASEKLSAPSGKISAGMALYEEYCADCHRSFYKTTKPQRQASRLRSSINFFPAMNNLNFLSDEQIEAIAAALATLSL